MNKLTYFLCVSLALTNITFFSIGFAQFTLFNAVILLYLAYQIARGFQEGVASIKLSVSLLILAFYISASNLLISSSFKVTSYIYLS
ncbi:MAG: hypothetical protein ABL895_10565, partial [Cyclobacteriaceae bacterium]